MDTRAEIRDFLTSRRARLSPAQAGLPAYGDKRRVPGLRRSEVAALAGLSVEYYTQLERGSLGGASESVLDSLARALRLDEAERTHLFDPARAAAAPARPGRHGRSSTLRPSLYRGGSRNTKRGIDSGSACGVRMSAYSAKPSRFAASTSPRRFPTTPATRACRAAR